jgi:hypothetical protein
MGSVSMTCCSTEEKLPENNTISYDCAKPIVYTYPTPINDFKPINYLPRSISTTTLQNNN